MNMLLLAAITTLVNPEPLDLTGPLQMVVTPANTVTIIEEHTMNAPNISMINWGVGFGTCPTDDSQTLTDLEISAYNTRYNVQKVTDSYGGEFWMLYAPVNNQTSKSLTIRYKATLKLNKRQLVAGSPKQTPELSDRRKWLQTPEKNDIYATQSWMRSAELVREKDERDVVFADRLLKAIQTDFRYKFIANGERGVPGCVRNGFGACGELNALVVDALRLSGIPARTRQGRNAHVSTPFGPEDVNSYHVTAEFWGEGIGWIPIEASAAGNNTNEKGVELRPFLGIANGDHVSKHYNFAYLDGNARSFQNQDWVFGSWQGSWDGWKVVGQYGVSVTPISNR